ncbi:S9 family peptidase [Aliiglaciecola sp. CAU 1673]|uniref:S9 family peptidase n=1 Tax=Aliiglaciecola sp. CAU 1673 TaxID=3032595 RepID=UPI0023DC056B|nr:S9 family peptidase [Aliiglaciecola sp. CAU 1673]MDF2180418.1 S9 family peptidase [Aliiglaciecola sp. CAU 1673]
MQKNLKLYLPLLVASLLGACSPAQQNQAPQTPATAQSKVQSAVKAPLAEKIAHEMTIHGDTRIDNYYWMRDDERKDPKVLAYLDAENAYTDAVLAHTQDLQIRLFEEMKGRIQKDDDSPAVKDGQYYYATEMRGENEYPVYVRSQDMDGKGKEVILDVNALAEGHNYFNVSGISVSENGQLMAYGEDSLSRRIYTVKFKDLSTGKLLDDQLEGTSGQIIWGNDNQHLYYIKKDPQTLLGYQVYRHKLGSEQSTDELVYEEQDKSFYTYLGKSKDSSFVYINHVATESKGISLIDANDPKAMPVAVVPREAGLEYQIGKRGQELYILTNLDAKNFRLMKVSIDKLGDKSLWQEVIPHRPDTKLEEMELFDNHLVYKARNYGQSRLFVQDFNGGEPRQIAFQDDAYALYLYGNNELDNPGVRIYYSSLTTPGTHYDVDLQELSLVMRKQQPVLGDFNADNYHSERLFIDALDGAKVPVSLVYRKDKFKKDGSNPLYIYGYGSYGSTIDPTFSSNRLSLLDRGFVFAIAHVRGSEMLGRPWYEDGKKLNKKNTFNDFVDATKALVAQGYGNKDKVFAVGGSAGGLLMGAVINQAPELYQGVAAHVPFVDVVTTMLDESIPLTTNEFDEWGNPKEKEYYAYMLSYSPYDQVKAQNYPNLLVTTGLHDSQVQYFEPAKWVAKLRDMKTDNNILLMKVDMEAGHGGASGRFKRLYDTALEYAFFLDLLEQKQ